MMLGLSLLKKPFYLWLLAGLFIACTTSLAFYVFRPIANQNSAPQGSSVVRLKPVDTDEKKTDIYLYDEVRGSEKKFLTLPDVYRDHYHAAEFHDGSLYIIRRPGGSDAYLTNPDWTDELWRYDQGEEGKKIYVGRGLDFRVSPEAKSVAIFLPDQNRTVAFLHADERGDVQRILTRDDLNNLASEDVIRPLFWSGSDMWFEAVQGLQIRILFSFTPASGKLEAYDLSFLRVTQEDFVFEPTSKVIAYSNYKTRENGDAQTQSAILSIYRLTTGEGSSLVDAVVHRSFDPQWIDTSTLEYNEPGSSGRIKIDIED